MFTNLPNRWKIFLQLVLIAGLCAVVVTIVINLENGRRKPGSRELNFRVEATGGYAVITLQAGSELISKPTTVTVPWAKTVTVAAGQEVYLTASNPTQTGKITCTITLGKDPWKSETTHAPQDGVACAGIVP